MLQPQIHPPRKDLLGERHLNCIDYHSWQSGVGYWPQWKICCHDITEVIVRIALRVEQQFSG